MKKNITALILTCFLVFAIQCIADEKAEMKLDLKITISGKSIRGYVKNISDETLEVYPIMYGWWKFTTVLYYDQQKWHEAKMKVGINRASIGSAKKIKLKPGEVIIQEQSNVIPNQEAVKYTFIINLDEYQLPNEGRKITKLRVVTNGLWSNIINIKESNKTDFPDSATASQEI